MTGITVLYQAIVAYQGGTRGIFLSTDGRHYYEHKLPAPGGRTSTMSYEKGFLTAAIQSSQIEAIQFEEVPVPIPS